MSSITSTTQILKKYFFFERSRKNWDNLIAQVCTCCYNTGCGCVQNRLVTFNSRQMGVSTLPQFKVQLNKYNLKFTSSRRIFPIFIFFCKPHLTAQATVRRRGQKNVQGLSYPMEHTVEKKTRQGDYSEADSNIERAAGISCTYVVTVLCMWHDCNIQSSSYLLACKNCKK